MKGGELMSSNILDYSLYVSGNFKEHYAKKQVKKNEIIIDQKIHSIHQKITYILSLVDKY